MNGDRAILLIVDDNDDMREHLIRVLAKWWDVEAVSDGKAALDLARPCKPDLILSDAMMPGLDGTELLAALRCDPDLREVPVILVSARAGEAARIEEVDAGADDYLVKPFSARELVARVKSNLSLSRLRKDELAAMTRLQEPSTRLTAKPDLPSILQEVLDAVIELQGADFGDVQLYDEATGTLKIVAHRGVDQAFLDHFETVDASDTSACGMALRAGARIIIEDVNTHPAYEPHRSVAASVGYRGLQAMPLFDRNTGSLLGMLSTLFRRPYRPSERELRLTDLYARQAADVIAFHLSEQALRDSEARLTAMLNQVPAAVGLFDPEGRFLLRGGALSALWDDVIPLRDPASPPHWRSFDANGGLLPLSHYPGARALRGEAVTPGVDFLHTADNGRETWIRVSAAPFRDDADKIVGTVELLQDVDADKRTEQRLRESETRLQAAVDLVKLGSYAWNPQTNEMQWDETLRALWSLPADASIDYDVWRSGVHPDDLARVEAAIQRCADPRGDGLYDIEYRVIGKTDGVERWIATRGRMHFANGAPASFFGVALDVTARKRIERTLDRRIEERTRELAQVNRQLSSQIEQREIAEATIQQMQRLDAIGQITSGVAHDFNNLLSVVLMNARLLARKAHDPDDQEGIDLIRTAAERGAKLVAQLLAFSRKQRLEPQTVDLNSRIVGMSDLLSVTLGGTVHLKTILASHLWPALVDPTQIELIVLNLALNARDAMQSGGTLTLETFNATIESEPVRPEEPSPGDYVGLAVSDTGVGIPHDVLPRAFEPFFTTKERGKGSGLGLAQVFGFAKQSGGGIRIETRVGEGTSVTVFLPRAAAADQERESDAAKQCPQTRRKVSILVVDDNEMVLNSTLRVLGSLRYPALPARSGEEALRLISSNPDIDLVLSDFAMPEMNGVELARAIHLSRPTLPVVIVTNDGDAEILREISETRILHKPYTEDDLIDRIMAALSLEEKS